MNIDALALILFILGMLGLVIKDRKRVEIKGVVIIWRTKKGKSLVEKLARWKYWNLYFDFGIIISFAAMLYGLFFLLENTWKILRGFVAPSLALVLPTPSSSFSFSPGILFVPATYWIFGIAAIILTHEPAHAIACIKNRIKIKSFGWLLFLIIPGAFVEPDEKRLKLAAPRKQLRVYCAGSFSNIVLALFAIILLHLLLFFFFDYKGLYFSYPYAVVNKSDIANILEYNTELLKVITKGNESYLIFKEMFERQKGRERLVVFEDVPAVRAHLSGSIVEINGRKINSKKDLERVLSKLKPGDEVIVNTSNATYRITLSEHPLNKTRGYLGIVVIEDPLLNIMAPFRIKNFEVKQGFSFAKPFLDWFLNLLSWISLISIAVAIVNMLPMKPFDGGLSLEALTSKTFANYFSIIVFLLLAFNFTVPIIR